MRTRNRRIGIAAATTVTVVAIFGAVGGVGLAGGVASLHQYGPGPGQYQYAHKVTICHKGKNTIRLSERAWPAHKRHGDSIGTCAEAKKKHAKKAHAKAVATNGKADGHGKKAGHGTEPVAATTDATNGKSGKAGGNSGNAHGEKNDD